MKFDLTRAERGLLERLCAPLIDGTVARSRADVELLIEQTRTGRTRAEIDRAIVDLVRLHFDAEDSGHRSLVGLCAELTALVEEPPTDADALFELARPQNDLVPPDPPKMEILGLQIRFTNDAISGLCAAWQAGWTAGRRSGVK